MRAFVATLSFVLTLVIGFNCAPRTATTLYEKAFPFFSKAEAQTMLGRRVHNVRDAYRHLNLKCPNPNGNVICLNDCYKIEVGETGEIVEMKEVFDGRFQPRIKWDKSSQKNEPLYSSVNRHWLNLFMEFEK